MYESDERAGSELPNHLIVRFGLGRSLASLTSEPAAVQQPIRLYLCLPAAQILLSSFRGDVVQERGITLDANRGAKRAVTPAATWNMVLRYMRNPASEAHLFMDSTPWLFGCLSLPIPASLRTLTSRQGTLGRSTTRVRLDPSCGDCFDPRLWPALPCPAHPGER
jgi:hypothetical protein